jgi:cytochrome c biogenesis protein CcdA
MELIPIIFVLVGAVMYFLPSIVAAQRSHHNATAIVVVNFFLGWTVIGWITALVWAVTNPPPSRV